MARRANNKSRIANIRRRKSNMAYKRDHCQFVSFEEAKRKNSCVSLAGVLDDYIKTYSIDNDKLADNARDKLRDLVWATMSDTFATVFEVKANLVDEQMDRVFLAE